MDITAIGKGAKIFFIGTFIMIILGYILPTLIDALIDADYTGTFTEETRSIIWFFVIIIYIMLCIVLPANYIIEGIKNTRQ